MNYSPELIENYLSRLKFISHIQHLLRYKRGLGENGWASPDLVESHGNVLAMSPL